ncbi:MAG: hypothetical protein C4519_24250 [Desulfobacteraceae bacterium]|nr:MAG: hypothetical protein C4519_24250 [Desulfobacteraceae bacterium]
MTLKTIFQQVTYWYERGGFTYHCQRCGEDMKITPTAKISPCLHCESTYWTDNLILTAIKEDCEKRRVQDAIKANRKSLEKDQGKKDIPDGSS